MRIEEPGSKPREETSPEWVSTLYEVMSALFPNNVSSASLACKMPSPYREPTKQVFLTFDDGPNKYSEKVAEILTKQKAKATFFMVVGKNVTEVNKAILKKIYSNNKLFQVANHGSDSPPHHTKPEAGDQFYKNTATAVNCFVEANKFLKKTFPGSSYTFKHVRLRGRNTWRVDDIEKDDRGTKLVADQLSDSGYKIYGWDVEWVKSDSASDSAEDVFRKIKNALDKKNTKRPNQVILLMHELNFAGNYSELEAFVKKLKSQNYETKIILDY